MMRPYWFGLIFCIAALASLGAIARGGQGVPPAQTAPAAGAQQESQQPIRVQVNLVNLFVTVRDKKSKRIVGDLAKDDFKVSEDGKDQTIVSFSRDSTLPVTLGVLIDTSGSEQYMLPAEQDAMSRFLARVMRKDDLAMVISFDSDANLLEDFTDDQNRLSRSIHRAKINAPIAQGPFPLDIPGTVFYDAVYLACHDELADQPGRRAIVVATDAQDEGSRVKVQDAIEAAQRSDTVVHILLVADPRFGGGNEAVAKKLTDETGGRTIVVRSERNMEAAFDEISEELRSQYTIAYYSTNTARDGSYRKIKVDTTRPKDLDVLTRRGYYAPSN
jgi:VWFA-related protein